MERAKIVHSFEVVVDRYDPSHLQIALNGLSRDERVAKRMQHELEKDVGLNVNTSQDKDGEVVIEINNIKCLSPEHTPAAFGYILRDSLKDMYPSTQVGIYDPYHRVPDSATDYPIRR